MAHHGKMKHGSSGSPKHTEHRGSGHELHNRHTPHGVGSSGTHDGPRIGPGVLGRVVDAEVGRETVSGKDGGRARGEPHGAYTEE